MKLPFLPKSQEKKEYFLALMLSPGKVNAILFEKHGESLLIAGTHSEEFSEFLNDLSPERLVELADIAISDVERGVPEGYNLEKTIFSVPVGWVMEGKILKDYLLKLKNLCESLSLTPIGFIVSIEAIIAYLQKKEGAPVTAIFVELSHKHLTVTIIKNGNILKSVTGEIVESPVVTTENLLADQEDIEVLPSKIVLVNYEHAKKSQQAFLSHHWGKKLSFLHPPRVDVLDPDIEAQSVVSGVAFEMGFSNLSVTKLPSEEVSRPVEIATVEEAPAVEGESIIEAEEISATEEDESDEKKDDTDENGKGLLKFNGEEAGFFEGVDVLHQEKERGELHEKNTTDEYVPEETLTGSHDMSISVPHHESIKFPKPPFKLPSFSIPKIPFGKFTFVYPFIAVVALILVLVGYYYFYEQVSVTLYLEKKSIAKDLAVSFTTDNNSSAADKTVHISVVTAQADGSENTQTTGKKETGDTAKGEITVYNKTEDSKTFSKGAVVVGPNNLEFDLSGDVQIASTSSFSTSFSSAKVKVEAAHFGKEYNLPSSSNFQFKGVSTSDVFAKNDSAFTGGTKKDIQVVSADDIDSLTSKAVDNLSQKAIDATSKNDTTNILPVPIDYSFDEKTFSKKEGEEASAVSLSAKISYKLGVYNLSDLQNIAQEIDKSEIPDGYTYSKENSKITVKDIKKDKDGNITGTLSLSSIYLPSVSVNDLVAQLNGKNAGKIDDVIRVKGVNDDLVKFTRSLPLFPKIFPFNKKNIEVKVSVQ